MSSSNKINIILAKANWCGYCKEFSPIFDKASKISKNKNLNFESYDLADDNIKNEFYLKHGDAVKYIEGYPTVILQFESNETGKYFPVNTAFKNDSNSSEEDKLLDAAKRFINNIDNTYKTIISGKKELYIDAQNGGELINKTLLKDEIFIKKYYKYKNKYLKLKY